MSERRLNDRYFDVAQELIQTEPELGYIANSAVRIAFLASDQEKKSNRKTVFGECEKIPEKYKWVIPYDFTITVFEPNTEHFTEDQIRVLLFHELLHVGIERDGNEEQYFVVPHDIEDFRMILERFGMEWNE